MIYVAGTVWDEEHAGIESVAVEATDLARRLEAGVRLSYRGTEILVDPHHRPIDVVRDYERKAEAERLARENAAAIGWAPGDFRGACKAMAGIMREAIRQSRRNGYSRVLVFTGEAKLREFIGAVRAESKTWTLERSSPSLMAAAIRLEKDHDNTAHHRHGSSMAGFYTTYDAAEGFCKAAEEN